MSLATGTLEIVPCDQPVFGNGACRDAADDLAEVARRDSGAGPLRPHIVRTDGGAGRDVADRNDAVERHVADILLARLNLFDRAARLLDRADAAHERLELLGFHRSLLVGAGERSRNREMFLEPLRAGGELSECREAA